MADGEYHDKEGEAKTGETRMVWDPAVNTLLTWIMSTVLTQHPVATCLMQLLGCSFQIINK